MSEELETASRHAPSIADQQGKLAQLRFALRQRRALLPHTKRRSASLAVAKRLRALRLLRKGRRIAVYKAIDGEIDLDPIIHYALTAGCALYEPHIVSMRARTMQFVALSRPTRQPHAPLRVIDPRRLDLVLVPLVAFDRNGWRLGFGAGFYDRKFAFLRRGLAPKPMLIGVGYDFQRVTTQKPQPWDVALDGVVTERRFYSR